DQDNDADHRERDQHPPAGAVEIVQPADRNRKAWQEQRKTDESLDQRYSGDPEQHDIDDSAYDRRDDGEEGPVPEFRAGGPPAEIHVVLKPGSDRLGEIHWAPPFFERRKSSTRAAPA